MNIATTKRRPLLLLVAALMLAGCARTPAMHDTPSLGVADSAMANGAPEFALRIAQTSLARDPGNVPAWVSQGNAYAALGNPFQANASYKKALAIDSRSVITRMALGRLVLRGNPSEAAGWFTQVLVMEPRNPAALNDLGIAQDLLGHHADAQANYRQAMTLQPDLAGAQVNLGLSLAVSGHAQEGALLIRPLAGGQASTPRIREDLATALLLAGQEEAARDALRQDVPANKLDDVIRGLRTLQIMPPAPAS